MADVTLPSAVAKIVADVAVEYDTTVRDILSDSLFRRHTRPRQEVMRRTRELSWGDGHPSYQRIGRWLGRHHSTVMMACRAGK